MKMKHNKKRNTAFLYECLVKELTKSVVREQHQRRKHILSILKEFFHKGSPLKQDLEVYRSILESKKMSKEFAQRFLTETRKDFHDLDRKTIFNEQTRLIKSINEALSPSAFANFMSNYKDIASIGTFFDSKLKAKSRLLIETRLVQFLTREKLIKEEMKHVDNLTYKTFVNKFNETYKNSLKENQKKLLTNYIVSFSDNGLGLKSFVNEEVGNLKEKIAEKLSNSIDTFGEEKHQKLQKVSVILEDFGKKPLDEKLVKKLFYIQDLVEEL